MRTLLGHRHSVRALAFAPGPVPMLASGGDDRSIRLWDPLAAEELALLDTRRDGLLTLVYSSDGKMLASGGRAGSLLIWEVDSQQRHLGSSLCPGPVIAAAFTPDGKAILAGLRSQSYGGEQGLLVCRNLNPLHPLTELDWRGEIESVAFATTRDMLAIASMSRAVELWDVGRPRQPSLGQLPGRIRVLAFDPAVRRLAAASGRVIFLCDLTSRTWTTECHGHRGDIHALSFSPDGNWLLSGGLDGSVRLWETASGRQLAAWNWEVDIVRAVCFSPDGMLAAASGDKARIIIWDIDDA